MYEKKILQRCFFSLIFFLSFFWIVLHEPTYYGVVTRIQSSFGCFCTHIHTGRLTVMAVLRVQRRGAASLNFTTEFLALLIMHIYCGGNENFWRKDDHLPAFLFKTAILVKIGLTVISFFICIFRFFFYQLSFKPISKFHSTQYFFLFVFYIHAKNFRK